MSRTGGCGGGGDFTGIVTTDTASVDFTGTGTAADPLSATATALVVIADTATTRWSGAGTAASPFRLNVRTLPTTYETRNLVAQPVSADWVSLNYGARVTQMNSPNALLLDPPYQIRIARTGLWQFRVTAQVRTQEAAGEVATVSIRADHSAPTVDDVYVSARGAGPNPVTLSRTWSQWADNNAQMGLMVAGVGVGAAATVDWLNMELLWLGEPA